MFIDTPYDTAAFVKEELPRLLKKRLYAEIYKLPEYTKDNLNEILRNKFKIKGIIYLINLYCDNLDINSTTDGKHHIIDINNDVKVNDIKLSSIIRFVDYGDLSTKGYHIFDSSLIYINNNFVTLYKYSSLGVM